MGKILKASLACFALVALTASCNSSGCLDNGSAIPLAGFYSSATARSISLDSLRICGVDSPGDSAIVRPGNSVSTVYLPMRPTAGSTAWAFSYAYKQLNDSRLNDTISFFYESIPYFASEECGAMYVYRINSIKNTTHLIDSVILTDSLITNIDMESIKIYFRTTDAPAEGPRQ
ncbi:MAG: DUF6452 family protein [Odoribacter sp.]|nr:DUF6452 family protein [Odoribacter sp.]